MKEGRCCICDGPIVNGRCKLCGMPYQKNEELYHVNEEREVHIRHASQAVREALREREIPLGDKKEKREPASNKASFSGVHVTSRNKDQQKNSTRNSTGNSTRNRFLLVLVVVFILIVLINVLSMQSWLTGGVNQVKERLELVEPSHTYENFTLDP